MIVVTFYAWKFVAGAFGVKVEKPWRGQFCGPFWLSLLGTTIGLPIVLLAYVMGAFLGSRKKEKLFAAIRKFWKSEQGQRIANVSFFLFIGLSVIGILHMLFYMVFVQPELGLLFLGYALCAGMIVLFVKSLEFVNKYYVRKPQKIFKLDQINLDYIRKTRKAKMLRNTYLVIFSPLVIAWKIVKFFSYMVYAGYKKFCPIVEYK